MVHTKILLKNIWTKNYSVKNIFLKDLKVNHINSYLKKQHFIKYEKIKKNFLIQYNKKYPVGYILQNQNQTVGFLGTLFSIRSIKNKKKLFCNIHSWLVDVNHRIASQLLFKKILNKCIITVLTARPGLTRTFKQMGFKSFQMKYRILCLINFLYIFNKKSTSINTNKSWIFKKIKKSNVKIYNEHIHEKFVKFIVYDNRNKSDFSFVVGKIVEKKKFLKILNIVYVDNEAFFRKNWKTIQINILSKFKIFFCGQYFLKNNDSLLPKTYFFSKNVKREIFIRNLPKNFKFNTLYSEIDL
jgi:hypothetical protein